MHKNVTDNLFYVDTLEGYEYSLKFYNSKKDIIVTDNPFLANDPKTKTSIIDISKLLSQEQGNDIGRNILLMSNEIEQIFINNKYKNIYNYHTDKVGLYLAIRTMVNTVIEKSLIFKLLLKNRSINKLKFFINKSDYYDKNHPWIFPRFTNVYKYLAEKSFFSEIDYEITELKIDEPNIINDTREKSLLISIITWPVNYILYKILRYAEFIFLKDKIIFYFKRCEGLSESLSRLFFKGYKIKSLKLPILMEFNKSLNEEKKKILFNDIDNIINKYLKKFSFSNKEISCQKNIIIDHIYFGLTKLSNDTETYSKYFSSLNSVKYILSAGFYGPIANQIFYLCNKYKITLIGFEHGVTAGLNKDTSSYIDNLESTTCNLLMVSSASAKKEFDKANLNNKESQKNKVYIIGEAEQKKHINFYKLQRYIIKKRYNIKKNEEVVVHVSGVLYSGNLKNAPSSPVSSYAFEREKKLLTKSYSNISKRVLYKKYPSQRFIHQPCYSKLFNLSANIEMVEDADFRYMRSVADIIVTDSNYSTIGWCLIKNVPLVYLMSKKCYPLLTKEIENLFKDSFFVINIDKIDWELKLKKLLDYSLIDLKRQWHKKKDKRKLLIKEYILGPSGSSSLRSANYIDELIYKNQKLGI